LFVTIPTWRATKDISIPEDLVEEVARVYGFGNIETELPKFSITPPEKNLLRELERKVKMYVSQEYGYTESVNYSFVSPQLIQKTGLSISDHIELDNPIAKDRPYLRRTLLPNLFENVEKNSHSYDEQYLFEVGKVFRQEEAGPRESDNGDELLPRQDSYFAGVYTAKKDQTPFFEISSVVRGLLENLGVAYEFKNVQHIEEKYAHPGRTAYIYVGEDKLGMIAELHPAIAQNFGLKDRVAFVGLNLNIVLKYVGEPHVYRGVSLYPPVLRDIAFVVEKNIAHAQVVDAIKIIDPLISHVELFDVYAGDKLGEGKKSMAYHITYLSKEKTLEAKEVDEVHAKVLEKLAGEFGAEVRK
jgi:phenylalanyl-tRNA synthetase beta chain